MINEATDDVKVAGYQVYKNGYKLGTQTEMTTFTDSELEQDAAYNIYTVRAIDTSGNESADSEEVIATKASIYGDANKDGVVSSIDYALLKMYLLNLSEIIVDTDINKDGIVDSIDYALLRMYLLNMPENNINNSIFPH